MQQDGHRVDEHDIRNHGRRFGLREEMRRDHGAVTVRCEHDPGVAVLVEDGGDLSAKRGRD